MLQHTLSVALALLPLGANDAVLRGRTLAEWRAAIEPTAEELRFTEIPWRASLWSAVAEAQAAELPVLLWAMNGHPLGCT
jgi:hypothetical protein